MVYHVHIGVLQIFIFFVGGVLLMGTAWRLIALHLSHSDIPLFQMIGLGMSFMY